MNTLKVQTGSGEFTKAFSLVRALLEKDTTVDTAKIVSRAYVMVGSRLEGVIERRRYGLNLRHRNVKCDLTRPELFQLCLFDQTEYAERREEDDYVAKGLCFDPNRLELRYVKFIVRSVFDAATFNVAIAISRQLFGLDWTSSEAILSSVIPTDQGQTQCDRVLRRLLRKLKFRFEHITEMGSDRRGHQYFHPQPVTAELIKAVHRSLRLVTPWGSSHVVPKTFRRGDVLDSLFKPHQGRLSRAARISGEEQAMIDRNRRHTFIDLKCFRRLAEASGIEGLLTNIRVPKFTIARTSDPSSGHNSSLRFNNEPPTEYWEHLFAEIAKRERMKAHFTGERLVVRINNHEVGYFVGKRRAQIGFEITEDDNIVSIAGFQEEEEIPLATLFPGSYGLFDLKPGHQWNGETRCGDARIGIRIKQLAATIDGDRSLSVEVNYQRARQLPAWTTIFIEPRIRARALQTAAAALLFAVSYGAYQFLTDRRPWEIPPVSVAKLAVEKNQTRTATKDHGENSASRTNRDKPTIAIGKGERKFSLNNRNFVHLLTLAPGVSDNLSPLQVQKSGIDAPKGEEILESTGSKMIRDVKKSETKQEGPKTGRIEPMQKDASELD